MNLSPRQRQAAESDAREIIVLAPAGSGKTATMIARAAYLVSCGVRPAEIMGLTFTRRSANEIRERLQCVGIDTRDMMCGTFHAVCFGILRQHGRALGYDTRRLTILSPVQAESLMRLVCEDLGYLDGRKWRHDLSAEKVRRFRESVYNGQSIEQQPEVAARCRTAFDAYVGRLREFNVLDFGQVLLETSRLFTEYPAVLAEYHGRIKHVLVDEIQDTDRTQFNTHDWFCPPASFFAIGDFRQEIYGWRGAAPDLVLHRHPNAEVIDLIDCYRCGDQIVAAANNLIAHNGDTRARPMVGKTGRRGSVTVTTGTAEQLAAGVLDMHDNHGFAWADIAVTGRTHRVIADAAFAMCDLKIPVQLVGGTNDTQDSPEFANLLACLMLSADPTCDLAVFFLREFLGLSVLDYAQLRASAMERRRSMWEILSELDYQVRPMRVDILLAMFAAPRETVRELIDGLIVIITDIDAIAGQLASAFERLPADLDNPADVIAWLGLRDRDAENDEVRADRVTCLTGHAAKGLEYPLVFVTGCNELTLPSKRSMAEPDGVLAERRLAYVMFTRAKERLVLHVIEQDDGVIDRRRRPVGARSRFIQEAGL